MSAHDQPVVPVTGDTSHLPAYATEHAAGADLIADIAEALTVLPGDRALVPTGLRMAIPVGYEGQVRPRSGLAWKKGLTVLNAPGTIDADYRGEVKVILVNLSRDAAVIEPGERIAQMVIAAVPKAVFRQVEELPGTVRGEGGFGSTGT